MISVCATATWENDMLFRKSVAKRVLESPWTTAAYGALAGVLATIAMEPVTEFLYEHEDDQHKKREEELRKQYDPLATLAARLIELVGAEPTEERKHRLATVLHWAYGMGWGILYARVRRRMPILRKGLGVPFGVLFALIGDEVMTGPGTHRTAEGMAGRRSRPRCGR